MSSLILDPLEKAISQLEEGVIEAQQSPERKLLRDGAIQRFEYTVDLAWKVLYRYLKHDLQVDESVIRSKKDLFREAARMKIIFNAEQWIDHYEARNSTSHHYNEEKANEVYEQVLLFLPDVKNLLEFLRNTP